MAECAKGGGADWAGNRWTLFALWGVPAGVMAAAVFAQPTLRAVIWTTMLLWMSAACFANARRCGRTHCRFTGPFFALMAAAVAAYAIGLLPIGSHGWAILGLAAVIGNILIWWGSERILGTFRRPS